MDACCVNQRQVAWQTVGGCALLVNGRLDEIHRLNRLGTAVWRLLADSAGPVAVRALHAAFPDRSSLTLENVTAFLHDLAQHQLVQITGPHGSVPIAQSTTGPHHSGHALRLRRRRVTDMAELVREIETTSTTLVRAVGDGFLVRFADGSLSIQTAEAAVVWDALRRAPCSFIEILDALCDEYGMSYDDAERIARPLLEMLQKRDAIRGLVPVRPHGKGRPEIDESGIAGRATDVVATRVRFLGRLDRMRLADHTTAYPGVGTGPVLRDVSGPVTHVAIVCQYGINGLMPGVGSYVQRCIGELRRLDVDLIIIAGGGRHGDASVREAESVVDLYRAHLPRAALWVENHSSTTWENLKNSLEMLLARSIVPRSVSLLGDRARTEKLRVSCWMARRRFAALCDVHFQVVPVARQRATWRDRRAVQVLAGTALLVRESRAAGGAAPS